MAIFTDIFLYGLVVPVMPFTLTVRSGVAEDQVQRWNAILFACYGIALFLGSPVAGIYADHTSSRRMPLLAGLLALVGATLLLCLGRNLGLLVTGRLLQGASAGVVWSVGLALLADTMGRRMGLAMGYMGIAMAAGLLLAPLVGGYVYAGAGYYAVYYVAFGLIALDILLRLLLIEKKVARQWAVDILDDEPDSRDPEKTTPTMTTATATATTTATPPPPPLGILRRTWMLLCVRRLLMSLLASVVLAIIMTSFDTILPLFTAEAFGWSSRAAGLLFLAPYLPPVLLSPLAGLLTDRWGAKWPALAGFATTLPLLVCLRFVDHDSIQQKVLLAVLLSLLGASLTLANVPVIAEVGFAIEAEDTARPGIWGPNGVYGVGYGLYTTAFALGSAVGSLMSGYLQSDYGWGTTTWVLGLWCGVGGVLVALGVGEFQLGRPGQAGGQAGGQGAGGQRGKTLGDDESSRASEGETGSTRQV